MAVFDQLSPQHLFAAAVGLALTVIHYLLARWSFWAGAILPALWCGLIVWYASDNKINESSAIPILLSLAVMIFCWLKAEHAVESAADTDQDDPLGTHLLLH